MWSRRPWRANATADDVLLSGGDTVFVNHQPMFYIYGQVQKLPVNTAWSGT